MTINLIKYPPKNKWANLCKRPLKIETEIAGVIDEIFAAVKSEGDEALLGFTLKFDKIKLNSISKEVTEITINKPLQDAIDQGISNISKFHKSQVEKIKRIETSIGVHCWRKSVPIENIGLYIPGGTAPLFSTLLMLAIPAKLAGCHNIVVCTPPTTNGEIAPVIEYVAHKLGIHEIYNIGGAQAIAAMTYGTSSIPRVDKIFGPGNQFVTKAKIKAQNLGIAIDLPAGPSEVLIIADESSNPNFVAADLLSQAEHGADSQVVLLSDSLQVLENSINALIVQLENIPRKDIASKAIKNSNFILLNDLKDCMDFANVYAPEHLILALNESARFGEMVLNAGSVFLGHYSCESAGDYASGTNHTLPTNGFARSYSGISLDSFVKKISFQNISKTGIKNLGPAIELMADAENLLAHKNAVTLRLKSLEL